MKGRILRLGLILVVAIAVLPACESLDRTARLREKDEVKSESEETSEPKAFFKSSRLSGAMSSEGRDIERSLGVH